MPPVALEKGWSRLLGLGVLAIFLAAFLISTASVGVIRPLSLTRGRPKSRQLYSTIYPYRYTDLDNQTDPAAAKTNTVVTSLGSWRVIGFSGAVGIHASLTLDNKVIFYERYPSPAHYYMTVKPNSPAPIVASALTRRVHFCTATLI
jgi:hypothetical protein